MARNVSIGVPPRPLAAEPAKLEQLLDIGLSDAVVGEQGTQISDRDAYRPRLDANELRQGPFHLLGYVALGEVGCLPRLTKLAAQPAAMDSRIRSSSRHLRPPSRSPLPWSARQRS